MKRALAAALKPCKNVAVAATASCTAWWLANRTPLPSEVPAGQGRAKTIFVSGGTNGLGLVAVKRLAQRGDIVLTCGRNPSRVAAVNDLPNVCAFVCDLASEDSINDLLGNVASMLEDKPLDVLINNAGVCRNGDPISDGRSLARLDEAWATNVRAPIILTQKLWPQMRNADSPIILNIGSTCSHLKFSTAFFLGYPVTKFALAAFSNGLRQELALTHPFAKVVHFTAGAFQTDMISDAPSRAAANLRSYGSPFDRFADKLYEKQCFGFSMISPGQPEDFANAVAAVVHPASGEGSLLHVYKLNVSFLEWIVPWLPQILLDQSWN